MGEESGGEDEQGSQDEEQHGQGDGQGTNWPFHQPESIVASSPDAARATATALTSYSNITTTSLAAAESPRSPCTSGSGTSPEIPESPTCSAAQGPESPSQTAH